MTSRILLIISLIFSLSLFSGMRPLYATCGSCGVTAPGDSGGGSVSRGGGGGMNSAAGAAAAFGLLFNVLQATRAQEGDADAGADLDALATEYATAFNVMDPTVSLELNSIVILQSGSENNELIASEIVVIEGGGVSVAVTPPEDTPGCSCGGDKCECVLEDECGVLFWTNAVSDWQDKYMETDGPEAAATWDDVLRDREERLNEAEKRCNKPGGGGGGVYVDVTPPEDTPGCSCSAVGNNCVCPEAFTCGGATHVVQWDGESGGVLSAEWVCGGASSGGTGVAIDVPPPEDPPVCSCGGGACKCPEEDACGVQYGRELTQRWSTRLMDAVPGSEDAQHSMKEWNRFRKLTEKQEKGCRSEPGGEPESGGGSGGGTGVAIDEPPTEDKPVCSCGGGKCTCASKDACGAVVPMIGAQYWSMKVMDATPGSQEAQQAIENWNLYRKWLEENVKECR